MRLYIAGPMRGRPQFNFPAFFEAERQLAARGVDSFNPARIDVEKGFDPTRPIAEQDFTFDLAQTIGHDLSLICSPDCDGVLVLDGWEGSFGARAEVSTALAIGKPVMTIRNGFLVRIEPTIRVVSESSYVEPIYVEERRQRTFDDLLLENEQAHYEYHNQGE